MLQSSFDLGKVPAEQAKLLSAHALGSPVPYWQPLGCWGWLSPPLKPPMGCVPSAALTLRYRLEQNHILENENLQVVKSILPPSFPPPLLPPLLLKFVFCCLAFP